MSDLAIRVENIGKRYRIGVIQERYRTLRDSLVDVFAAPYRSFRRMRMNSLKAGILKTETALTKGKTRLPHQSPYFWALRDINFDVHKGQVLGVIGRNGAGKSTLLKILSRVTEPDEGMAEIHGRVGSLLEVGTGFHPELTGTENIFLNGAILGMKRSEIARKFDEIVAFAEVDKFIDTPVKRYSSGMYLRLAFAVAAHLEPEILVVDEVLAVGDAEFQRKCLGKMSDVAEQGRTVLFVSHNMSAILRLTQEAILLDKGKIIMRAPTSQAVDYYMASGFARAGERIWNIEEIPPDAAPFRPIALRVGDASGRVIDTLRSTEPIHVTMEYALDAPITGLRIGIYLLTMRGEYVFTSFDTDDPPMFEHFGMRPSGHYISRCIIPPDYLNDGRYVVGMNASSYRVRRYFQDENTLAFTVDAAGAPGMQWLEPRFGPVRPRLEWQISTL